MKEYEKLAKEEDWGIDNQDKSLSEYYFIKGFLKAREMMIPELMNHWDISAGPDGIKDMENLGEKEV